MTMRNTAIMISVLVIFGGILLFMSPNLDSRSDTISQNQLSGALSQSLRWRSLGPAHFGGRISALAIPDKQKYVIYCAAATGGLWKTTNNGTTWNPVFDGHGTGSIGAVAVAKTEPNTVWVGTGEAIGSWFSAWGDGVYKSTDGGMTWAHRGLQDSHQIRRIVIDPSNADIVYVAAVGHLWGPNHERGLFKTTDGGKTWINSLYINDDVGVVDVAMDPSDSKILYAAAYGRRGARYSGNRTGCLDGGGIYKTTNAGETWIKLVQGLPDGRIGKIGLCVSLSNPDTVYAIIEKPRGAKESDGGGGVFRSDDKGATWNRVNAQLNGDAYYSHIYVDPRDHETVYVPHVRMWKSKDGGLTFKQAGWAYSSWMTSSYIHGDFHPLWLNPADSDHIIVGTDGGLYSSYDGGQNWESHPLPIGQFYTVTADMRKPYYVYGGTQDNGGWAGPSATRHMSGVVDSDWYKYETADGGYVQVDPTDNMTIYSAIQYGVIRRIDARKGIWTGIRPMIEMNKHPLRFNFIAPFLLSKHDPKTMYMGAQLVLKTTDRGDNWSAISPALTKTESATITSLAESPLKPGLIWAGTEDGNIQVSQDDGNIWEDLTPHISRIIGETNTTSEFYVSRVEASHFDSGTAYVSFDGHKNQNFDAYLYKTNNFGKTWTSIKGNLPDGYPIRVVREDMRNPDLLFVGTWKGVFMSIDGGECWTPLENGLPPVPVQDMVIHPREADLIIGTFGRGIYILDIAALRGMNKDILKSDIHLFEPENATLFHVDITKNKGVSGARRFFALNPFSELFDMDLSRYILSQGSEFAPPGAAIYYHLGKALTDPIVIRIFDDTDQRLVRQLVGSSNMGINRVLWDLRESSVPFGEEISGNDAVRLKERGIHEKPGPLAKPGRYRIILSYLENHWERMIEVLPDENN